MSEYNASHPTSCVIVSETCQSQSVKSAEKYGYNNENKYF